MIQDAIKRRQGLVVGWRFWFILLGTICLIWNPASVLFGDAFPYRAGQFITIWTVGACGLASWLFMFDRGKVAYIHQCREGILKVVVLSESAMFSCDFCALPERVVLKLPLTGWRKDCGELTGVTGRFRYHKLEMAEPGEGPRGFDLFVYAQGAAGEATSIALDELLSFWLPKYASCLGKDVRFSAMMRRLADEGDKLRDALKEEHGQWAAAREELLSKLRAANETLLCAAESLANKALYGRSDPARSLRVAILATLVESLPEDDSRRRTIGKQLEDVKKRPEKPSVRTRS